MLNTYYIVNYSFIISFLYFCSYIIVFFIFFFIINIYTNYSTNFFQIVELIKYSKNYYYIFVIIMLTFIGIPPLLIFTSKFAALTVSWFFNNFIFFLTTLFITFLSFTLYLNVFDLLFKTNIKLNYFFNILKEFNKNNRIERLFIQNYSKNIIIILLLFLSIFGFFFFKDLFLCLFIII